MALHHRTPFPGNTQILKPKTDGKASEAPKIKVKEPQINREKRVFGTVKNQNAVTKAVTEKPIRKPISGFLQKQTKLPTNVTPVQETENTPKKPSETKKKIVNFRKKVEENKDKILQNLEEGGDVSIATPLKSSPFVVKQQILGTPYQSAERCSKCRFDKLETSSYWLGQIRLAESVGKHFVSAAFFRLASECKAEPFRNIKVELKKYLARHDYLSGEKEWKDLSISYGLLKEEINLCKENEEEGTNEQSGHKANIHDEQGAGETLVE
ncbi:hypothetical protein ACH5RR_020949 [Cinchona calisaya]|uniref:Uncharacterized protein n=1 Tax=Cinchona calisaya TaxID=153742 RepID=A0ABD2ZFX0_9GENT